MRDPAGNGARHNTRIGEHAKALGPQAAQPKAYHPPIGRMLVSNRSQINAFSTKYFQHHQYFRRVFLPMAQEFQHFSYKQAGFYRQVAGE